jgi:RNA polymerase sigma-70 factor (ECF subfamily)
VDDSKHEDALMAAYAQGDRRAFEQLFMRLAPRIHAFFLRSFGEASTADDLLQQTFLRVHRARDEYRPELPVRSWMFAIAARLRIDEIRRRYRLPAGAGEDELDSLPDPHPRADPSAEVVRADVAAAVRAALERLPQSQRAIVHLHRYEGMTFPEIAKALGTTEGAVKLRAFRAYERLRKELGPLVAAEVA